MERGSQSEAPLVCMWSIAAEHYPSDDVRARVEVIERANSLHSPLIEVGETLRLPA